MKTIYEFSNLINMIQSAQVTKNCCFLWKASMQIDKNQSVFNSTARANRQIRDDGLAPEGSVCLVINTFLLSRFRGEQE
jgi:hypothetical protein